MTDKNLREEIYSLTCHDGHVLPEHVEQDWIDRIKAAIAKDQEEKNKTKT